MNENFLEKIEDTGKRHPQNGEILWKCKCNGGFPTCKGVVYLYTSRVRYQKSCGCIFKKKNNNLRGTLTYRSWQMMKYRCHTETSPDYKKGWGSKGVSVCDRWMDEENGFLNFLEDMGDRPSKKYTLDRIDNERDYCPNNCRWALSKEQIRNSRVTKLTEDDVRRIKNMIKGHVPQKEIAEQFDCSRANISAIACGKSWVDIE